MNFKVSRTNEESHDISGEELSGGKTKKEGWHIGQPS
jgi:hypothetical protein